MNEDDLSNLTERQRKGWEIVNGLGEQMEKIFDEMIGEPVWRSADGRVSPISKMDDNHLKNSIRMLARRGDTDTEKYHQLQAEYKRRQEGRKMHRERVIAESSRVHPSGKNKKARKEDLFTYLDEKCRAGASLSDVEDLAFGYNSNLGRGTIWHIIDRIRMNFEAGIYE